MGYHAGAWEPSKKVFGWVRRFVGLGVTAITLRVWTCLLLECKACLADTYTSLRTPTRQALHSIRAV